MSYRDEEAAIEARIERLEAELAELEASDRSRARRSRLADLEARRDVLLSREAPPFDPERPPRLVKVAQATAVVAGIAAAVAPTHFGPLLVASFVAAGAAAAVTVGSLVHHLLRRPARQRA